jgi:hypothetical protein
VETCGLLLITYFIIQTDLSMATPGYSGTPLIQKLGIKPGMKVLVNHSPENYFKLLLTDISGQFVKPGETPDLIHLFAETNAVFEKEMKRILPICRKNSMVVIWVSWYKKSSGIVSDLSEEEVRNYALKNGLVDVKVCAVSNEWSGLKLVVPLAKR